MVLQWTNQTIIVMRRCLPQVSLSVLVQVSESNSGANIGRCTLLFRACASYAWHGGRRPAARAELTAPAAGSAMMSTDTVPRA